MPAAPGRNAPHGHVLRRVLARPVGAAEHGRADRHRPRHLGLVHVGDAGHRPRRSGAVDRSAAGRPGFPARSSCPTLAELGEGLLWFRLTCESAEGRLRALGDHHRRRAGARRPPRCGDHDVQPDALRRRQHRPARASSFKAQPETADDVSVIIVDNARNLELPVHGAVPVEIVPNPNLGGAGGFASGLWEHRRRGQATHVLFMDDDIAFEPEVIARTVGFLRFAVRCRDMRRRIDDADGPAGSAVRGRCRLRPDGPQPVGGPWPPAEPAVHRGAAGQRAPGAVRLRRLVVLRLPAHDDGRLPAAAVRAR